MSICIPLKICMAFSLVTGVVGECVDDGSSGVSGGDGGDELSVGLSVGLGRNRP